MKRYINILSFLIALCVAASFQGCIRLSSSDPFEGNINKLDINAVYPEGYSSFVRQDVEVTVENVNSGDTYICNTDASGNAETDVPNGIYRVSISDRNGSDIFNGSADKVNVSGKDVTLNISLTHSKGGTLVIKEIYCGGCSKYPQEGTYQSDQYMIIHNNDSQTEYLDSLCLGTLSPYNSTSTNPWISHDPVTGETIYKDFIPVIQAVWEIGGDGTTFPLQPGEDAVICLKGAIDHTVQYPLSVNLNNPAYFVCYNSTYFPNTTFHPVPGDQIRQDHILDVVVKTGQANAYTVSSSSPAVIIFKARGISIQDFVKQDGSLIQVPGSTIDYVTAVPVDWVIDGIEIFDGRSTSNAKRLTPVVDAGYVSQSDIYQGHTLFRHTDEDATAKNGFEVLEDTNNSTNDLYERETQSLHK
ncbi:MAG: DUF4876 domain-containing protein [Bacteroidales bacterium]|jgi:hypothetical protein|nr:DUF4876 domain-containing protein [Bacteroidales bacterium]MCI1784900.1 DUF4876 domain-containing protein [Bacteroidales bacterium]